MNKKILAPLLIGGATFLGFGVGLAIGRNTREAVPSSVTTEYTGGVVVIKADLGGALKQGIRGLFG